MRSFTTEDFSIKTNAFTTVDVPRLNAFIAQKYHITRPLTCTAWRQIAEEGVYIVTCTHNSTKQVIGMAIGIPVKKSESDYYFLYFFTCVHDTCHAHKEIILSKMTHTLFDISQNIDWTRCKIHDYFSWEKMFGIQPQRRTS